MPNELELSSIEAPSWLLPCLQYWAKVIKQDGRKASFSSLAIAFGDHLKELGSLKIDKVIQAEITRVRGQLAVGLEDYGTWRSTRGYPSYDVYLDAKRGVSAELSALDSMEKYSPALASSLATFIERFGSLEKFTEVARSYLVIHDLVAKETSETSSDNIYCGSALNDSDISLCLAWSNVPDRPRHDVDVLQLLLQHVGNYDACRLLSARSAELAAISYYKQLSFHVEDISIRQINWGDDRWRDCDMLAGEAPLDVKNARSSFTSPGTYVEHCVPRFKLNRKTQDEVSIVGVLSSYVSDPEDIIAGLEKCQVLGQVNVTEIRDLYRWMRKRFGPAFNIDGVWNPGFLPGWIFDYPVEQYTGRSVIQEHVRGHLNYFYDDEDYRTNGLPVWMLALAAQHPVISRIKLPECHKKILNDLSSLGDSVSIKRSSIYLYCMGFLLEAMLSKGDGETSFDALRELLFSGRDSATTLLLIDPQAYVRNLVRMLTDIHAEAKRQDLQFRAFQMPHPGILRGQLRSGSWMTLIAYCGGWLKKPVKIRCGASPLFFGRNETCTSCERLICSSCKFCSKSCHE